MRKWKLWLVLLLGLLVTIVVLQNTHEVEATIFWMDVRMPMVLFLVTTAAVGLVIGLFVADRLHRRSARPTEPGDSIDAAGD